MALRGDSHWEPVKAPLVLGLIARLGGTRRICPDRGSLLPFYYVVDGISFLCDFFYYPQFLLILWLPAIKIS